jgi:ABC-2 type transport system permease protein
MKQRLTTVKRSVSSLLRGMASFVWLEYKALRFYPATFFMTILQSVIHMGVWLFISQFISGYADNYVADYGGSYVAYVVLGVAFHEMARTALQSPFASIQTAFWDKRLETYRIFPQGFWAYIFGSFLWKLIFAFVLQIGTLLLIFVLVGMDFHPDANIGLAALHYLLFVFSVFGLGMLGASTFFLLEVKRGMEPLGWIIDYAVRLTSGLYYPVTIIPAFIRPLSGLFPHTYAFRSMRMILLQGATVDILGTDLLVLTIYAPLSLTAGYLLLRAALIRTEAGNGVGAVV